MIHAAELRRQVESALAERIPAALSLRPPVAPELLACGVAEVDAALGGGLPLGAITELTGAESCGRTTLLLATLAGVTRCDAASAYVDVTDTLDPVSAAALGVDLRRLLWVRAGERSSEKQRPENAGSEDPRAETSGPEKFAGAKDVVAAVGSPPAAATAGESPARGMGWRHPRNEVLGMPHAVGELFGAKEKKVADFTPRCSESIRRERVQPVMFVPQTVLRGEREQGVRKVRRANSWTRLDQALRATDLLLSAGGFRALVLDMGDVPPEQARRVPLATWYRFRLQAEKSRTLFLLVTRVPCAGSCASVSLACRQTAIDWRQAAESSPLLLAGLRYRISVARSRAAEPMRKRPAAGDEADWASATPWLR